MMSEQQQALAKAYRQRLLPDVSRMVDEADADPETLGVALLTLGVELHTFAGCSDQKISKVLRGLADLHEERGVLNA